MHGSAKVDLGAVFHNKYRGYSYSMSLSTMPDFDTGPDLQAYIEGLNLNPAVDDVTMERLTIDPVQERVTAALQPFTDAYQQFNDISGLLGGLDNLDDLAAEMLRDAISPF